jgi:hypothetical protein
LLSVIAGPVLGNASPTLFGRPNGVEAGTDERTALRLDELFIDAVTVGDVAQVTIDARFSHHGESFSEGIFEMQLPVGATITGYALDIGGEMIDGVLVPRGKARIAFEERVRGRIDPGLAEVSRGNLFTTRVFPVDRGGRRVRLSFVAPFDSRRAMTLPLQSTSTVATARIRVRAEADAALRVTLPSGFESVAKTQQNAFTIDSERRDVMLAGSLHLTATGPTETLIVSEGADGSSYFQLRAAAPETTALPRPARRVRVYWDTSRSRLDQDVEGEIDVLTMLLARLGAETVDLVAFNSSGIATTPGLRPQQVAEVVGGLTYGGATSLAVLLAKGLPRADRCLLFSDGIVTIDARVSLPVSCRSDAIANAPDADLAYLMRITAETGGSTWSLTHAGRDAVVEGVASAPPQPIAARDQSGKPLDFARLEGGLLVGRAPAAGPLIVTYVDSRGFVREERYGTSRRAAHFTGTGAAWAAARVTELGSMDRRGAEAQTLARRHSVATTSLSFLVLDTPADFVDEAVAPPATYPAQLKVEYDELKGAHDREQRQLARNHLDAIVSQWRELERWWQGKGGDDDVEPRTFSSGDFEEISVTASRSCCGSSDSTLSEILVTGMRIDGPASTPPAIAIEIEPWSVDRPYIRALDGARLGELDATLRNQERAHGELPAFYFDVANWLDTRGERARAVETLLSALELGSADEQTAHMVAGRLLAWGEIDRAIFLYEKLLAENQDRPQPRRWLAMALAEAGDAAATARAVELLLELVRTPWDEADDGIAMISLLDANALLTKLSPTARAALRIDPRLVAALHFDLRVLLEWNTEATDMDLWITEPTDEDVYYGNANSAIGGRLSNDMTEGYGPEEYLLRNARPGTYEIVVDSYAADRLNPNGTTVVTARLIRDFGRPTQREEALQIELHPDDQSEHRVGRFVVTR